MAAKTSKQLKADEKKQIAKINKLTGDLKKEKANLVKLKQSIKLLLLTKKQKKQNLRQQKKQQKRALKKFLRKVLKKQ